MSNNELQQHHSSSDSKALSDDDLLLVSGGWGQQPITKREQELSEKHGNEAKVTYNQKGTERHGFLWQKKSPIEEKVTTYPDGFVQRTTTRVEVR